MTDISNWRPIRDGLIVKRDKPRRKTEGGVDLPESSVPLPSVGVVLQAGPGRVDEKGIRHAMDIKPGQRVVFARNVGVQLDPDDETVIVISERDVMAIDHSK